MKRISYDTSIFQFRELVKRALELEDLTSLNYDGSVFTREKDQGTKFHKQFYKLARTIEFKKLYYKFIKQVILPLYDEEIIFQTIPSFRIAFPNNVAVGDFHKDKEYRDQKWAQRVREDNFFLPLTDAFGTNTIWVESQEDKGDYAPMNCKYGETIQWDGSNLSHGNKINQTGKARVSVDFRVIRKSNYVPSDHPSINAKTEFKLGGYYTSSEEI